MSLAEIESKTKDYADARTILRERMDALESELTAIKKRHITGIKRASEVAAGKLVILKGLVEEHPDLFKKPRTVIFNGIKVGFRKGKGGMNWEDDEDVVRRIQKYFPDQFDTLVKTKLSPKATGLEDLSAAELKKLGVEVTETGDEVVVKATDSDIDKLVNALLKDEELNGIQKA
ncbi:MAG: hypothetical protein GX410_11140 [Elusimicrobia bacterium]|nr:hypothetical protein [Elusimicrobiota bacterium]